LLTQAILSIFTSTLIVPLVTAWTFGEGFLSKLYLNDESGCLSIHFITGMTAFIGCVFINERTGKYERLSYETGGAKEGGKQGDGGKPT